MGLLDRLFAKPDPEPTGPQPSTRPRGGSGRAHTGGFLELEELNLDLVGQEGLRVYDRMWRTDPDVHRVGNMLWNPIKGGTWIVEPHGGDEATDQDRAIAEEVQWALFDFMRPGFKAHLSEAAIFLRSGFGPFEQIWGPGDYQGRTVLAPRKLGLRLPRSIQRWEQDDLGDLTAIEQWLPTGGTVLMPRRDLVYYRIGAEGDNWEGVSALRPVYKPWFFKDAAERLDAIGLEREAVGIPVVYPPRSTPADDPVLDDLEDKLADLRAGEQGYIIMPGPRAEDTDEGQGWHFEIVGFGGGQSGSGRSAKDTLAYHRDAIAAGFIAEFMRLGQSGEGARATADVQQNPFHAAVEGVAGIVEDEINESLVVRYCQLNHGTLGGYPRLKMDKADSTALTELADYAQKLSTAGFLFGDDVTEDWLRERADMPAADPEAREERKAQQVQDRERQIKAEEKALTEPAVPPGGGKPPGPKKPATAGHAHEHDTFARQQRDLRWWEQHMALDAIEQGIDQARARFEAAGGEHARAAARSLAEAVAEGRDPDLSPPDELVAALHEELVTLYALGRDTVQEELARQRTDRETASYAVVPFARDDAPETLFERAFNAAMAIMHRIWQRIARYRLQGHDQPADLQTVGEDEAARALRAEAMVNAAPALNEGRSDEADDQADRIKGSYYTSLLDANSCERCKLADDDVLRPLTDPIRIARKPPNRDCEGGDRCRCMESFVLKEENAPQV